MGVVYIRLDSQIRAEKRSTHLVAHREWKCQYADCLVSLSIAVMIMSREFASSNDSPRKWWRAGCVAHYKTIWPDGESHWHRFESRDD